jgi:hypothetical protein
VLASPRLPSVCPCLTSTAAGHDSMAAGHDLVAAGHDSMAAEHDLVLQLGLEVRGRGFTTCMGAAALKSGGG